MWRTSESSSTPAQALRGCPANLRAGRTASLCRDPIGHQARTGVFQLVGRQFRASLFYSQPDRQMQIACPTRADSGCQMDRQGADDGVAGFDSVNIEVSQKLGAY